MKPLLLLALAGIVATSSAIGKDIPLAVQEPYTHPQRLVEIAPNRHINLYCTGHGQPTVVFDYGLGSAMTTWIAIHPAIAKTTQACTYDRAGQGFSDPGPLPRDTGAIVSDLHALLAAAGIRHPFIFVGHSLGGLAGTLYADTHLNQLAGMVLVDPSIAHQGTIFSHLPGMTQLAPMLTPNVKPCEDAARAGTPPTTPTLVAQSLRHNPAFGAALTVAVDRAAMRPDFWVSLDSERQSFDAWAGNAGDPDSQELDAAQRTWGGLPVIVLTSSKNIPVPGATEPQRNALHDAWVAGHDALAARSTRGANHVVLDSGHDIQNEHPDVVIAAIETVIREARGDHH